MSVLIHQLRFWVFFSVLCSPLWLGAQTVFITPSLERQAEIKEERRRFYEMERLWNRKPEVLDAFLKDFPGGIYKDESQLMKSNPQAWIDREWKSSNGGKYQRRDVLVFARKYPNSNYINQARELLSVDVNQGSEAVLDNPNATCISSVINGFTSMVGRIPAGFVLRTSNGQVQSHKVLTWVSAELTQSSSVLAWPTEQAFETTQVEERDYFDLRVSASDPKNCSLILRHQEGRGLTDCQCRSIAPTTR